MPRRDESEQQFTDEVAQRIAAQNQAWTWPGTLAFIWFWTMVAVTIVGCVYFSQSAFWNH